MNIDFTKVAPYLQDPLVLAGFVLFLFFGFARYIIKKGLIPTLQEKSGYRILQTILLYGFIFGLAVLGLGFGLKYNELSSAEQRAAIGMLGQELKANMQTVKELSANTATLIGLARTLALSVRTEGIPVFTTLFPVKNLDLADSTVVSTELARTALEEIGKKRLDKNRRELAKAAAASVAIRGTIGRTKATIESLGDLDGSRYPIRTAIWDVNLPILRKISLIPLGDLHASYSKLATLRNNYDILVPRVIDYCDAMGRFTSTSNPIDLALLADTLGAERLAFQIATAYGNDLVSAAEELARIQRSVIGYIPGNF